MSYPQFFEKSIVIIFRCAIIKIVLCNNFKKYFLKYFWSHYCKLKLQIISLRRQIIMAAKKKVVAKKAAPKKKK
jgi:hypothetical protein